MRKLNFILGFSAICASMFFTSCSSDSALGPALDITSGEIDTVPANSIATINWRADAGDANLQSFTIKEGNATIVDEDGNDWNAFDIPNADNEHYVGSARVLIGATTTSFTLIATDKDGLTASKTVSFVISQAAGDPINSYTAILMGGQSNLTVGSYLDADAGNVYLKAAALTHTELVDVVYYFGSSNLATLTAPNDVTVNGGAGNLSLCSDFTTKNATKFGTSTITTSQFATITDDLLIAPISGLSGSKMTSLAVGDIIDFQTAAGKKGIIKVSNITTGADGSITLDVKVQQ
jgi:hypothetical protein